MNTTQEESQEFVRRIRIGRLVKSGMKANRIERGNCSWPGCQKTSQANRIDAHHPDYDKPYQIVWLCSHHHKMIHKNPETIDLVIIEIPPRQKKKRLWEVVT